MFWRPFDGTFSEYGRINVAAGSVRALRTVDPPTLWIIAGPNGSGKSSLYGSSDFEALGGSVWIINPDLLTSDIAAQERLDRHDANLQSVRRIEQWLYASIATYRTIGVETVLSTEKYRRLVTTACDAGYRTRMLYVLLDSADRQVERVRLRVATGGHDVPEEAIRRRRAKSFEQLAWFADAMDACDVYDNSTGVPELSASKVDGRLHVLGPLPEDCRAILRSADMLASG